MTAAVTITTYSALVDGTVPWNSDQIVWYIGSNYARLRNLEKCMDGRMLLAPVGEKVNEAAHSLLPLILNLEKALAGPRFDRSAWNASDIADRSRFNSPFFLELSRSVAVLDALSQGQQVLVIADDDATAIMMFDTCFANGFEVSWQCGSCHGKRLREHIRVAHAMLRRVFGDIFGVLRRKYQLHQARTQRRLSDDETSSVQIWIVIWATEQTFAPGQRLDNEERMGRLPGILRDSGLRVGYIVFPLWPERFRSIVLSCLLAVEPVIFVEDSLDILEILSAAWRALRVSRGSSKNLSWKGLDLSPVLRRARICERMTGRPMLAELLRGLPAFLKKSYANPMSIVTTYENHSWEKVLTEEMRRYFPQTLVVGYNHASFSSLYTSLNPSPGEIAANVIPDYVLTLGPRALTDLSSRGFPTKRLAVAGGLRYESFLNQDHVLPETKTFSRVLLCCVGVDLDEGFELVQKVAESIAEDDKFSLLVNFHPMNGVEFRDKLKSLLASDNSIRSELIRFDDRSVRALLQYVDTVLYIDSNAALEAAAAGRRIIYVQRETGLDYDKMPTGLSIHCRTPKQIREALEVPVDLKKTSDLLKNCISLVNVDVILDVILGRTL